MRLLLIVLILFQGLTIQRISGQHSPVRAKPASSMNLTGRWHVKFAFTGDTQKNLEFEASAKGSGHFMLLDIAPDDKPVPDPHPAAWSQLSNDRVSFSGEVELPLGTCCRDLGTLIFKGKFVSRDSISGKLVFVTSVDEEESPYKLRSMVGTFTAIRIKDRRGTGVMG